MNRLITMIMGLLILGCVLVSTGCTPLPYQETCYVETEVILVPVPVPAPYPVPIEVEDSYPPPWRKTPLTKPHDSGNPRTKNPAGDRGGDKPVIARGGDRSGAQPKQVTSRPAKRPGPRRR